MRPQNVSQNRIYNNMDLVFSIFWRFVEDQSVRGIRVVQRDLHACLAEPERFAVPA